MDKPPLEVDLIGTEAPYITKTSPQPQPPQQNFFTLHPCGGIYILLEQPYENK